MSHESLTLLVDNSDAIITGMVVEKDIRPNGELHVWLGSYEWLSDGIYDERQLFLEQNRADSLQAMNVKFDRGEELLLFLKNVDVKRGAYDLFSTHGIPAQKYSINLRDAVVTAALPKNQYKVIGQDHSQDNNCYEKLFGNDAYWYCTTKKSSHVPIEAVTDAIREKLLEDISEEYLEKHFDLVTVYDEPEPTSTNLPLMGLRTPCMTAQTDKTSNLCMP